MRRILKLIEINAFFFLTKSKSLKITKTVKKKNENTLISDKIMTKLDAETKKCK